MAVAAVIVGLEAIVLLIVGILLGISLMTSAPSSLASGIFLLVLLLAFGAGLAAVALNLFRGYRWTRSAAFVWQLLMLTIAVPTLLAGQTLTGLLLIVPPLVVAVLLFTPKVVAYTLRRPAANHRCCSRPGRAASALMVLTGVDQPIAAIQAIRSPGERLFLVGSGRRCPACGRKILRPGSGPDRVPNPCPNSVR